MSRLRESLAAILALFMALLPAWGASPAALGTIISAERAHVGTSGASVGATVFSGDQLSTEEAGSMQIRAGGARFMLSASSSASLLAVNDGPPSARLFSGTAVFSTAGAKAFTLYADKAHIRPQTDEPTIAQVSIVSARELTVRSTRGPLIISVDDEMQIVPSGSAYRVILDPTKEELAVASQGSAVYSGRSPTPPGRTRFLLIAIVITGVITAIAIDEALESPSDP